MNAIQTPLMARLVPVALVSLGLLLASPAGAASMTEPERCNWKADKVENRYSKCLSRSTTRLSNVLNGSTLDEDFHCAEQFHRSMDVIERRATFKEVGAECEERLTPESQACTQAAALIVAGRDLGDYRPQFDDLSLEDLACSPIQAYLQDSYDDGYDAGYDTGYDDGEASVDVASNDQSVCEAAGGTWENDACTPASSYDCFIGGFCAQAAVRWPPDDHGYINVYDGHTQGTEPALGAGCSVSSGSSHWLAGKALANALIPGGPLAPSEPPSWLRCANY